MTPVRVGVLVLDSIDEPHRSIAGDYPELFERLLSEDDLEVICFDGRAPELPDPASCNGWLIPGSRTSVYGDDEWLPALRSWTSTAIESRLPLAGVCFGHQLVAQVLGSRVGPADVGWNIGAITYEVKGETPSAPLGVERFTLLASHQDQVAELPAGATLIASAPTCPIAAYAVDDVVLCVQAHPEFVAPLARSLYESRIDRIGAEPVARAVASLDTSLDRALIGRWLMTAARRAATSTA